MVQWFRIAGPNNYFHAIEPGASVTVCGIEVRVKDIQEAEYRKHLASRCDECRVLRGYGSNYVRRGFGHYRGAHGRPTRTAVLKRRAERLAKEKK